MARLTVHAREQIAARPVATEAEVLRAVNSVEPKILSSGASEVRVIVKTLKVGVVMPDGSNGDVVLACVDPRTRNIKTVMLQRHSQVERKMGGSVPYLKGA